MKINGKKLCSNAYFGVFRGGGHFWRVTPQCYEKIRTAGENPRIWKGIIRGGVRGCGVQVTDMLSTETENIWACVCSTVLPVSIQISRFADLPYLCPGTLKSEGGICKVLPYNFHLVFVTSQPATVE